MSTRPQDRQQGFWPFVCLGIAIAIMIAMATQIATETATSTSLSADFVAVEDTYINETRPISNYGARTNLEAETRRANMRILTRFRIGGLPEGASITSATLRLFVTDPSNDSGAAYRVVGPWSEATATWSNAPGVGNAIASGGRAELGTWREFNVTSAVSGNDDVDFYVISASKDGVRYSSSESGTNRPTLAVRLSVPTALPSASPTETPALTATTTPTPSAVLTPVPTPGPTAAVTPVSSPPPAPTNSPSASAPPTSQSRFVTANGRSLYLAGSPYRFVGVNRYNLLTIDPPGAAPFRGCGSAWSEAELASWFSEISNQGIDAVRLWAFQRFTASGTDFARMDYLLSVAEQHNVRVIPTFENQWQDCTEGGYKRDTWYASGYLSPYGSYTMSFRDYVGAFVNRYKNDHRILMWQLMNEAEIKTVGGQCGNPQTLKNFAADVSAYIKSIDTNHLVNIGTMGGGQCGAQGAQYQSLHDIPTVDVCEFHDYNHPAEPMPGDQWNGLQVRFNQCNALNKPLFMGEAGIKSNCADSDCYTLQQRADFFRAKMTAFYNAGGVGYAIWSYRDRDGIDPPWTYGATDPLAQITGLY